MKLQIAYKAVLVFSFCTNAVPLLAQSAIEVNVTQHVAIESGNQMLNGSIDQQKKDMKKTALLQGAMGAEMEQMRVWEGKYNSYLKTVSGYAEALKAGATLYAEGVIVLRNLYDITKASKANPEGIVASMSMNNLYMEAFNEMTKTYNFLKKTIAKGGELNMLTGKERTELLWTLNDNMYALNQKLHQVALSIAFYNLKDVWNRATAGMVDKSHGQIAEEALDRWKRAQTVYKTFGYSTGY